MPEALYSWSYKCPGTSRHVKRRCLFPILEIADDQSRPPALLRSKQPFSSSNCANLTRANESGHQKQQRRAASPAHASYSWCSTTKVAYRSWASACYSRDERLRSRPLFSSACRVSDCSLQLIDCSLQAPSLLPVLRLIDCSDCAEKLHSTTRASLGMIIAH